MERILRRKKIAQLFSARNFLSVVMLLLSLFITYRLWDAASRLSEKSLTADFEFRAHELSLLVAQRLQVYEQVLRGGVGLYAASDQVTRREFAAYVRVLDLQNDYPGIQGIGFAQAVPPAMKPAHEAEIRRQGFPAYRIWPEGERDMYTSIVFLEPFTGRNLRAFGYDMYSDPVRREAMALARDTGKPAMSSKVQLVQETSTGVQTGFLMYLPVYRNDLPSRNQAQRRANLLGWVYAPFRMNDLMEQIQDGLTDIDIEIFDGDQAADCALMYDSEPNGKALDRQGKLKKIERISIANHRWTMVTAALPAFMEKRTDGRPLLILKSGISISLLLALLVWVFLDDRARAIQAADQAIQLALYDALTALPNRKLISDRLQQAVAKAKRAHSQLAVLFIDLDKFKPVNDELGHGVGDLLLREVARRLQSCMREADTVARLGGDEFLALLVDIGDRHSAQVAANKILHALMQPFEVAGHTLEIAASIGVALYPQDGADPNALVKSADMAMYQAKNAGRSTVRFADGLE